MHVFKHTEILFRVKDRRRNWDIFSLDTFIRLSQRALESVIKAFSFFVGVHFNESKTRIIFIEWGGVSQG